MAVNSCKLFDETASWRSKDDVINMTKAATPAGDIFNNNHRLDDNCNNNNNRKNAAVVVNRPETADDHACLNDVMLQQGKQPEPPHKDANQLEAEHLNESELINNQSSILTVNKDGDSMKLDCNYDEKKINGLLETISVKEQTMVNNTDVQKSEEPSLPDTQETLKEQLLPPSGESIREDDEQAIVPDDEIDQHPDWIEERFRVDRKKLEQMLQAAANGKGQTGDDFFGKVMNETNTEITWPSKIKIGAKSKKDPHIKVRGKQEDVVRAKLLVMQVLDTKCTRVTLKMDVSHTEHSHVIGKGGNNIKRVMEETGCHIHFPDSNRNSNAEKSNQVSIAGQPAGVDMARGKIRELLPIVVSFDLSMSGSIPDPNSAPIQQIVQLYSISVQFKQRMNRYCTTTCTVRGSNDNMAGLVEGTLKLMQHLTGGAVVHVTSQMEVAPQQHSYMMGRNGCNIKHIMQRTDAQITFPDPNYVPKKSTILITGNVQSVVMARQRLMGCLPLVLMFDMKQDDSISATEEASKNNQLMESLDVFISIKLKPKQPSKSVIVKSVERNIYNMFEARRQLLKLDLNGLKTPPPSTSPPPVSISSKNNIQGTPMIHLTPSTHLKPHYIGIIQPNNVALVNGQMTTLSRPTSATPTGASILRPNWAASPLPSPSQSPFPMSQQGAVAAIQAQQQQNMLLQAQLSAQQQQHMAAASRSSSMAGSPPSQRPNDIDVPTNALQLTQQFIQENNESQNERLQQKPSLQDAKRLSNVARIEGIPGNLRGLQRQVLEVQKKIEGRISASNSFNKGNSGKSIVHSHSFSDSNLQCDEFPPIHHQARHSLADCLENCSTENINAVAKSFLQVGSPTHKGIPVKTPPGSDSASPLSERLNDFQAMSPESNNSVDLNKQVSKMHPSPHSSASSADLKPLFRNLRNSPTRGKYLHPDRLNEQPPIPMTDSQYMRESHDNERSQFGKESPAPPPGFNNFPKSTHSPLAGSDYETMRQKAYEAMQSIPVASEVRTPTVVWAGKGFSKSMPSQEWKRLGFDEKFKQNLDTTFEMRDDGSLHEEATSPEPNPLTMSQHLGNSSNRGVAQGKLLSWREKNLHNLSQSKDLRNSLPKRRQHSTFDPLMDEFVKPTLPPPPHPNDDNNPVASYPSSDPSLRVQPPSHISNQPLEAALSLLTNNHLGGHSNCVELHDLLSHLNLEKYSEVFSKQEVDLQTFLTLTESDLTELGIKVFGPKRKILLAIEELKKNRNLLYGNALSAAPGGPTSIRAPQPSAENLGDFLNGPRPQSPTLRGRRNPSQLSSSRLLHNPRGIVSQSGRW
ncbi:protein bicaudal C homolog 1-A-like [Clavelina lepadiformis]|uniref:protein bicaudal C homolog 1-A-like n=1 Tax=Clavelina lepadiformis TaxID=159417 RepID=UPI0040432ADA